MDRRDVLGKQIQHRVQRMNIEQVELGQLEQLLQQLLSAEMDQVQESLRKLKILFKGEEEESYLKNILDPQVVQRLIQLSDKSFDQIIYSSAIDILATSSSAEARQTQVLIKFNIIDRALQWLWYNDIEILKSAIQIIGNLADSIDNTTLIVDQQGVDQLIKHLEQYQKQEDIVVLIIWALSNITRYSNVAEITIPIFRYAINQYLQHQEILQESTEILVYITSKGYLNQLLENGVEIIKSLNYLLQHPQHRIVTNALTILNNVFSVTEIQIDLSLVEQILKSITPLLQNRSRKMRILVFNILSHIAQGSINQIMVLVRNEDLINTLFKKLATEKDMEEKQAIHHIFINLITCGNASIYEKLMPYEILAHLINALTVTNPEIIYGSLRALQKILSFDNKLIEYKNIPTDNFKNSLEMLTQIQNEPIQQIAEEILHNYVNIQNQNEEIQN